MQILILPGYSTHNKDWVEEVSKNLNTPFDIRPFYWMHWTDESAKFDAREKAILIAKHLRGDRASVIAKSIGTLVASYLYKEAPSQIEKMIFCGIPLTGLNNYNLEVVKDCISGLGKNFKGFQNTNDPHGSFEEAKNLGDFVSKERSDHEYPYFDDFNNFLS